MTQSHRGRPPHSPNPDASHAARLGAEIRARRQAKGLTLKTFAGLIGFSSQHLSQVELAKAPVSGPFVAACDRALEAQGSLLELLPAVNWERAMQRHDRSAARYLAAGEPPADTEALARALDLARYAESQYANEAGEDVDPLSRRSLFGAGVGAAVGLNATTAPAATREIDPRLVEHWLKLLSLLDRHAAMLGSHEVLATVRREIERIAEHRQVARGELRTQLLRVESRWAQLAAWLSNDTGDARRRDAWTNHALSLAREAGYDDMVAYLLMRQSQWAAEKFDARRAITFADAALSVPRASQSTRALCASKAALGHALAGDADSCERSLAETARLLSHRSTSEPATSYEDLSGPLVTAPYVRAAGARCWLALQPQKAVTMLEDALRRWPRDRTRDRGLHQSRLALACAATNEPDRAAAEGIKALNVARTTMSDVTVRELKRLDRQLTGHDVPAVGEFREALAGCELPKTEANLSPPWEQAMSRP